MKLEISAGCLAFDPKSEDQACVPTDRCLKFECDHARLQRRGRFWCCTSCGSSYGEDPFGDQR
jgi:hypothetical protein